MLNNVNLFHRLFATCVEYKNRTGLTALRQYRHSGIRYSNLTTILNGMNIPASFRWWRNYSIFYRLGYGVGVRSGAGMGVALLGKGARTSISRHETQDGLSVVTRRT